MLGHDFPAAREILRRLLPDDEIADVPREDAGAIGHADVVIPAMGRVQAALMDAARPRLIQQFGVGLEGVDLDAAAARGIPVANVPAGATGNAVAVAEVALMHLLAVARDYGAAGASVRAGRLGEPMGTSLDGKAVAIVGLGAVGREVAARLVPFGVRLVGVGRRPRAECPPEVRALPLERYHLSADLAAALADVQALVLCCTLTPETRGLIGDEELGAMPPGAWLINVARGPLVRYAALLGALRSGRLAGAGLDVFWEEPIDPGDPLLRENVSVSAHVGGVTHESYAAMAQAVAGNVERLRRGEAPLHAAG